MEAVMRPICGTENLTENFTGRPLSGRQAHVRYLTAPVVHFLYNICTVLYLGVGSFTLICAQHTTMLCPYGRRLTTSAPNRLHIPSQSMSKDFQDVFPAAQLRLKLVTGKLQPTRITVIPYYNQALKRRLSSLSYPVMPRRSQSSSLNENATNPLFLLNNVLPQLSVDSQCLG
ncbi:hypothetical protein H4582DRAFT_764035 [Lactarius indigo]|nr:hypothetical protein H4582DRAFT_764035 [Lactarius indigo]